MDSGAYSGLIPACWATFCHFCRSRRMKSVNSAGALDTGVAPSSLSRLITSGRPTACPKSREIFARHVVRYAGRCHDADPGRCLESRQRLGDGRHVRCERRPLEARHAQRSQAALLHLRPDRLMLSNTRSMLPASRSVTAGALPRYGTCTMLGAGHQLEQLAGEMDRAAVARAGEIELSGILLQRAR